MNLQESTKKRVIDKCQIKIWKMRRELESYSTLFKSLDLKEVEGDSLYGIGLTFERMSKNLDKINTLLTEIY